jgi:hypothetical protein
MSLVNFISEINWKSESIKGRVMKRITKFFSVDTYLNIKKPVEIITEFDCNGNATSLIIKFSSSIFHKILFYYDDNSNLIHFCANNEKNELLDNYIYLPNVKMEDRIESFYDKNNVVIKEIRYINKNIYYVYEYENQRIKTVTFYSEDLKEKYFTEKSVYCYFNDEYKLEIYKYFDERKNHGRLCNKTVIFYDKIGNIIKKINYITKYYKLYSDEEFNREENQKLENLEKEKSIKSNNVDLYENEMLIDKDNNKRRRYLIEFERNIPKEYENIYIFSHDEEIEYVYE